MGLMRFFKKIHVQVMHKNFYLMGLMVTFPRGWSLVWCLALEDTI